VTLRFVLLLRVFAHLTAGSFPEVVLSQIIPAFRFAPSKAEIIWKLTGTSNPTVKGSAQPLRPRLPLIVSRI